MIKGIISEEDKRKDFLNKSNERLKIACLKKIDTTMIGSLDIVEKEINEAARNLSKEDSITLRDAYSRIRSKILDNGNNQKRATNEEFKHYTISWNMYTLTMPVKTRVNREEADE
jgi:hypothetical protein